MVSGVYKGGQNSLWVQNFYYGLAILAPDPTPILSRIIIRAMHPSMLGAVV